MRHSSYAPTRRGILGGLIALATTLSAALPACASEPVGQFVESLGRTAIRELTEPGITRTERERRFRALLTANFDLQRIARFVLGRYARTVTPEDLKAFAAVYEDYMVLTYARLFASYAGESFRVTRDLSTPSSRYAVVKSEVNLPGGSEKIALDWQILTEGGHAVVDLRVEGVSMAITQRDEFASILSKNDGSVPVLNEALRRRVANLRSDKPAG